MPHWFVIALIVLQALVVAFIGLHDWVRLGPLNDLEAVHAADSRRRLILVTALSTLPFAVGLGATLLHADATRFPGWLSWYLYVAYGLAGYGLIRAWWGPYLLWNEPIRAARYEAMFGRTHAFLPARNGIRPNTLHVGFHLVVVAIIAMLAFKFLNFRS